jgi:hypothetical protein
MTAEDRPPDANNTRQDGVKDFKSDSKCVRSIVSTEWFTNLASLHLQHFAMAKLRIYTHPFTRVNHPVSFMSHRQTQSTQICDNIPGDSVLRHTTV